MRKLCIHLSILLKTGLKDLEDLSIFELIDIAQEVTEIYGSK